MSLPPEWNISDRDWLDRPKKTWARALNATSSQELSAISMKHLALCCEKCHHPINQALPFSSCWACRLEWRHETKVNVFLPFSQFPVQDCETLPNSKGQKNWLCGPCDINL